MGAYPASGARSADEVLRLLRTAILEKRAVAAVYQGYRRLLCPHMLGRNHVGQWRLLAYQYGGESQSGLQSGNWRCLVPDQLRELELRNDPWQTGERQWGRPTCIEQIELEVDQPQRDPQKGQ